MNQFFDNLTIFDGLIFNIIGLNKLIKKKLCVESLITLYMKCLIICLNALVINNP